MCAYTSEGSYLQNLQKDIRMQNDVSTRSMPTHNIHNSPPFLPSYMGLHHSHDILDPSFPFFLTYVEKIRAGSLGTRLVYMCLYVIFVEMCMCMQDIDEKFNDHFLVHT